MATNTTPNKPAAAEPITTTSPAIKVAPAKKRVRKSTAAATTSKTEVSVKLDAQDPNPAQTVAAVQATVTKRRSRKNDTTKDTGTRGVTGWPPRQGSGGMLDEAIGGVVGRTIPGAGRVLSEEDFVKAGVAPPTAHRNPGMPALLGSAAERDAVFGTIRFLEERGYVVKTREEEQAMQEALLPNYRIYKRGFRPGWSTAEMLRQGNTPLLAEMRLIWNDTQSSGPYAGTFDSNHWLYLFDVHSSSPTANVVQTYAVQRIKGRLTIQDLGSQHYTNGITCPSQEVLDWITKASIATMDI